MTRYLARRIAISLVTLWAVVTLVFFLVRVAPGGPFDGERRLPPEVEANLRAAYHLDEPLLDQYARYVAMLARGDFGPSFRSKDFTVNELIARGLPVSLAVGGLALALAAGLGIAAGTVAGLRRDRGWDRGLTLAATAGLALPPIVVAPLLVLVFAVTLRWLPAGGFTSPAHVVLPAVALALPYLAAFTRLTRGSVAQTLGKVVRHALRERARVDEYQRGTMLADQRPKPPVDVRPLLLRGDGFQVAGRHFDGKLYVTLVTEIHDFNVVTGAHQEAADLR